jgi:hypothetical protein
MKSLNMSLALVALLATGGLGGCMATVAAPGPVVVAPAPVVVGPGRRVCGWESIVGRFGGVRQVWRCHWVRY